MSLIHLYIIIIILFILIIITNKNKEKEKFTGNKLNDYEKFNFNIIDIKKLPNGYSQKTYYNSDLADTDINILDNIENTCTKKCSKDKKCAGVFIWNNDNNNLSSCNIIKCSKNNSSCNSNNLLEFYKKNKNAYIMDKWPNSNTYIKK